MSATLAIQIADAITTGINAADLSTEVTAQRLYVPAFDLRDLKTLHVSVVPRSADATLIARQTVEETIEIDLAVQQVETDPSELDGLMLLTDEIVDLFQFQRLTDPVARCNRANRVAIYDPAALDEKRLFRSVTTLEYTLRV